jgi:hypothetical protein
MATWQTVSTAESMDFILAGGGITNHEVFAFALQGVMLDVGAQISNVTVFGSTAFYNNQPCYFVTLEPLTFNPDTWKLAPLTPAEAWLAVSGNFESNEV